MPDFAGGQHLSWGIVENTSIGYVYVYSWVEGVRPLFASALSYLISVSKVTGLILDFRYNLGGGNSANNGLDLLFNEDPGGPTRWQTATRDNPGNHFSFSLSPPTFSFTPRPDYYDRPIAVLTGPAAWSYGDLSSFMMRLHPMVRFFGLPTNGAFVAPFSLSETGPGWGTYYYARAGGQMRSLVANEGFLMHKGFPVDEQVWLTRDGVAQGEDDVVKRALEWIGSVCYAHNVQLAHPTRDTLLITTRVENPLGHALDVTVTLRNGVGALMDSLSLMDDGLHGDGAAGDSIWGSVYVPSGDALIHASVRTDDLTLGTSRTLPDAAQILFTRQALITMDTRTIDLGRISMTTSQYDTTFFVRNIGYAADSLTVSVDPGNVVPDMAVSASPNAFTLSPGDSQQVTFSIHPDMLATGYYAAQVIVEYESAVDQMKLQKDFLFQVVLSSIAGVTELPTTYVLGHNYPNPFNPSTTIRYGLPLRSHVLLTVYNTLGQQVAQLVNGDMEAGYHEVKFDGSHLASGVYLYRMRAGSYVETRKLLLMK